MTGIPIPGPERSDHTLNVTAMLSSQALGHDVEHARVIETHISWVLLTGTYAYKIRKPVVMPFLDFSTREARQADCEEELRLNRRWAPMLYLEIVAIHGPAQAPSLVANAAIIDYAVKMRQFGDRARLDHFVTEHGIDTQLVRSLARTVAGMHLQAPPAEPDAAYGTPASIAAEVQGNITALAQAGSVTGSTLLREVSARSIERVENLRATFLQRRRDGRCRECHGDLHLENLAMIDGEVVPFDAVEFEPAFRWVDTASDLAFLLMDLHARGFASQAQHVLNEYLQHTGDYALLAVLEHYLCYRAMVRAKIAAIRSTQFAPGTQANAAAEKTRELIVLAAKWCKPHPAPKLIITHGVSGSGKSWLAQGLATKIDAICIRSDVERKRLRRAHGTGNGPAPGDRYSSATSSAVYAHLLVQAGHAIDAGMNVIVDATYLAHEERSRVARWAAQRTIDLCILSLDAPRDRLEQRIRTRLQLGEDASEANAEVLAMQLAGEHDLHASERASALLVNEQLAGDIDAIVQWLNSRGCESDR